MSPLDSDELGRWDCVIVGGGAAGLSAALILGRARHRVLVIDAGTQSNLPARGIGGLLGNDTRAPADFYARGRHELAAYPTVQLRKGNVVSGERGAGGFSIELSDGARESARRVLLATGMDYRYPSLPGIAELWGRSVFHCPFCHGWEVRDEALGALGRGADGLHRALLLSAWSEDVTLLSNGPAELEPGEAARLEQAGVKIDERHIAELGTDRGALSSVVFVEGGERRLGGLLVPVTLHQRDTLAAQLGANLAQPGPLSAETVQIDQLGATAAAGLYAAGDLALQMPSVANAIMGGSMAGAALVGGLTGAVAEPVPAAGREAGSRPGTAEAK